MRPAQIDIYKIPILSDKYVVESLKTQCTYTPVFGGCWAAARPHGYREPDSTRQSRFFIGALMDKHGNLKQALKDYREISKAYYRLLKRLKTDRSFIFTLSRKELLILKFGKVENFRGEWLDSEIYDQSEWEDVQCTVSWDEEKYKEQTGSPLYRDDLRYYGCKDDDYRPIPEEVEIKSLTLIEPAEVASDLICDWLESRSEFLKDKFSRWPGPPVIDGYSPRNQNQSKRYNLAAVDASESEYLCRLGSVKPNVESNNHPADADRAGKKPPRITQKEADIKGRDIVRKTKIEDFDKLTYRVMADRVGCSIGAAYKIPALKAVKEKLRKTKSYKPKTVRLSNKSEAIIGTGKKDEVLNQLIASQESDDRNDDRQAKLYKKQ